MNIYSFLLGYLCCMVCFEIIILLNRYKRKKDN